MSRPCQYQCVDIVFFGDLSLRFAEMRVDGVGNLGWTPGHINSRHYHGPPEPEEVVKSIEVDHHECADSKTNVD